MELTKIDFALTVTDTLSIKGVAIIGMLCWHLFFCQNPLDIEFSPIVRFLSILGDSCVSIFLFVSAYGLTVSYSKQSQQKGFFLFCAV